MASQQWPSSVGTPVFAIPAGGGTAAPPLPEVAAACPGPPGIAKALLASRSGTAARFWVVDNSGSMNWTDGRVLQPTSSGAYSIVNCTRWDELRSTVTMQAQMAVALRARIDFHLLNPCSVAGARQFLSLGQEHSTCPSHSGAATLADLQATMSDTPRYKTPLTEAVVTIHSLISGIAPTLKASGQQVVVILATDGHPDDPPTFVHAVQQLQRLGCVWLVVRLCTEEDEVVDYWNDLDKQLEAPLEVLDDVGSEAKEILKKNPWLTYGLPLHMLRVAGVNHKIFDLMDERPFIGSQVAEMCSLIFGCAFPNPEADWDGFARLLGVLNCVTPRTYSILEGKMMPWIRSGPLEDKFQKSGGFFGSNGSSKGLPASQGAAQTPANPADFIGLQLTGRNLKSMDLLSHSDPFFTVSLWCGGQTYAFLAHSEACQNKKSPKWSPLYLSRQTVFEHHPQGALRVHVFDWEKDHKHQLIGSFDTTAEMMLRGEGMEFELEYENTRGKRGAVRVAVV